MGYIGRLANPSSWGETPGGEAAQRNDRTPSASLNAQPSAFNLLPAFVFAQLFDIALARLLRVCQRFLAQLGEFVNALRPAVFLPLARDNGVLLPLEPMYHTFDSRDLVHILKPPAQRPDRLERVSLVIQ